jgi:hypothetical protein
VNEHVWLKLAAQSGGEILKASFLAREHTGGADRPGQKLAFTA